MLITLSDGTAVDLGGASDIGSVREENEDQYLIADVRQALDIVDTSLPAAHRRHLESAVRGLVLLVADGVGGNRAGATAAALTIDAVIRYVTNSMRAFYGFDARLSTDLMAELAESVHASHQAVLADASRDSAHYGMATTLTKVHVMWPRAYVVQIGDSRCYRYREGSLQRVTEDQTLAQCMIAAGTMTPAEAEGSRLANVLTTAIGGENVEPVISALDLRHGDTLLLCSDGLTKHVSDKEIAAILGVSPSSGDACQRLIGAALEGGGSDNVTVVVSAFRRVDVGHCGTD